MITLGIETSCDETSAAVVNNGKIVLSNIVASSLSLHKKYGGVIPEIASRAQLEFIYSVVSRALKKAKIKIRQIGLIAVTKGPGLSGSLLVGVSFAKTLSFTRNIPLIGINHIQAHLYAPFFSKGTGNSSCRINFPFVGLVISGGHTSLFLVKDFNSFSLLGRTVDDAVGEAFDKAAKIMGLGYPGGPFIEKIARKGKKGAVKFSCGNLERELDFSFSGIKTAVLYRINNLCRLSGSLQGARLNNQDKADIACAFQETVFDDIIKKSILACQRKKIKSLVAGGGVASNNRFRDKLNNLAQNYNIKVYFPQTSYCLDNAAMVAGFGYQLYKRGISSGLNLRVEPT